MNVLDAFARMARASPDSPALVTRGKTLSYRQLWRVTGGVSWHLAKLGVARGDCVAVTSMSADTHLVTTMALARMGAISTPMPARMPPEARRALVKRHGARVAVYSGDATAGLETLKLFSFEQVGALLPQGERPGPLERDLDDQPWRISLSSGTTGSNKSIPWTHAQRVALQARSLDVYPAGPGERLLVYADMSIGLALGHALAQLASGGVLVLPTREAAPAAFEALLEQAKPTRVLTTAAVAFQIADHFKAAGREAAQNNLLSMVIAGATVPPAMMHTLEEHVCRNVLVSYGSTELGTSARSDPAGRLERPEAAGRVMPWLEAQAVDDRHQPLPAGQAGVLRFRARGGEMATGYFKDPEATAKAFRDGWFYPGDLGSIDEDGYLVLHGRHDDRINVGGTKLDPQQVEALLNEVPGVRESAVVAVAGDSGAARLVAAVVTEGDVDLKALQQRVAAESRRIIVVRVPNLPRNEAGKVDRALLARKLRAALKGAAKKEGA